MRDIPRGEPSPTPLDVETGRTDHAIAFRQAVDAVGQRTSQLRSAIDKEDAASTEHLARNAVDHWFTARAAFRKLEAKHPGSPMATAAMRHLEAARLTLLRRFKDSISPSSPRALAQTVAELRVKLESAELKPDPGNSSPAGSG